MHGVWFWYRMCLRVCLCKQHIRLPVRIQIHSDRGDAWVLEQSLPQATIKCINLIRRNHIIFPLPYYYTHIPGPEDSLPSCIRFPEPLRRPQWPFAKFIAREWLSGECCFIRITTCQIDYDVVPDSKLSNWVSNPSQNKTRSSVIEYWRNGDNIIIIVHSLLCWVSQNRTLSQK